ncbi:DUF805 domain-containing protein [Roseomonas sp. KE0001]|uniref:DUF805 domain-containing protein n=1 Tax=Roseomonas sp. KE0001 TaxID=2479201 RepID=UPI001E3088F8|nr:DUF805 domain-containing protein [Roseomonas sp. KE0001]
MMARIGRGLGGALGDWISFRGRIPLGRYWLTYVLPLTALQLAAILADILLFGWNARSLGPEIVPTARAALEGTYRLHATTLTLQGPLSGLWWWVLLVPGFAGMTKRWHDRGASGWWSLLLLVPVLGWIWVFVSLCCRDGQRGPNRYGPDPLEPAPPAA